MWRASVIVLALVAACGGDADDTATGPEVGGDANDVSDGGEPGDACAAPGNIGLVVAVRPDVAVEFTYAYVTAVDDIAQPVRALVTSSGEANVPYSSVEWSPGGALSYYVKANEGASYWLDPRCSTSDPITVFEQAQRVVWSPDGAAFASGRSASDEIVVIPMADGRPGEPVTVATIDSLSFDGITEWSPDATMLRFQAFPPIGVSSKMQVVLRNGDGWSAPLQVPTDQPAYDEVIWPLWSPDSRSIVYDFRDQTTQGDVNTLELVEVGAPDVRHVLAADPCYTDFPGGYSNWAPDGSRLLFWVKDPSGCRLHVARRTATGWTTRQMTDGLWTYPELSIIWSSDSRHLLRRSSNGENLLWSDASAPSTDPVVITPAAPEGSYVTDYKLSPDESTLAILRVDGSGPSGPGERRVLYLSDMSSGAPGELVAITTVAAGAYGGQIAWAPDSSRLSVEGREDGAIIEIASGAITPYGFRYFRGWSSDSRWIALAEYLPDQHLELTVRQVVGDGLGPPLAVAPADLPASGSVVDVRWAPGAY
jgi:hypothetical protein